MADPVTLDSYRSSQQAGTAYNPEQLRVLESMGVSVEPGVHELASQQLAAVEGFAEKERSRAQKAKETIRQAESDAKAPLVPTARMGLGAEGLRRRKDQERQKQQAKVVLESQLPDVQRATLYGARKMLSNAMREKASAKSFGEVLNNVAELALHNKKHGPPLGGEKAEWNYPELDEFLAEAYVRLPPLREDRGGFLSKYYMAPGSIERQRGKDETTIEWLAKGMGIFSRVTTETMAKLAGAKDTDVVLAYENAKGHEMPGIRFSEQVPELVEAVEDALTPKAMEKPHPEELAAWRRRYEAGEVPTPEPPSRVISRPVSDEERVEIKEKAQAYVALGAEMLFDPTWFVGFGEGSKAMQATRQVARALTKAGLDPKLVRRMVKETKKNMREAPERETALKEAHDLFDLGVDEVKKGEWEHADEGLNWAARNVTEETTRVVLEESRDALARLSIHDARDEIAGILRNRVGDAPAEYLMNKVGPSFGKAGIVGVAPFRGEPIAEIVPREVLRQGKEWGQQAAWWMRRQYRRGAAKAMGKKIDADIFQTAVRRKRNRMISSVAHSYTRSFSHLMDNQADWAANTLLERVYGPAIRGELEHLPPGATRAARTAQADERVELATYLADALGLSIPAARRTAILRFAERLEKSSVADKMNRIAPDLEALADGKWPDYLKQSSIKDPTLVVPDVAFKNEEFRGIVDKYQGFLDSALRETAYVGREVGRRYKKEVREAAGRTWADWNKKFLETVPDEFRQAWGEKRTNEIRDLIRWSVNTEAAQLKEALMNGIDIAERKDYWVSVLNNTEAVLSDVGFKRSSAGRVDPGGPSPMQQKKLTMAEQIGSLLSPERDILKMAVASSVAHNRMIMESRMNTELVRKFGRPVATKGEAQRMGEVLVDWRRKGKGGKWEPQTYAVPSWMKDKMDEVLGIIDGTNLPGSAFTRKANAFLRSVYTSPNPGFHIRNELSSTILSYVLGNVRDPRRYAQSYLAAALPRTEQGWQAITKQALDIKDPARRKVALYYARKMEGALRTVGGWTITQKGTGRKATLQDMANWAAEDGAINKGWSSVDTAGSMLEEVEMATRSPLSRFLRQNAASAGLGTAGGLAGGPPGAAFGAGVGQLIGPDTVLMKVGKATGEVVENHQRLTVYMDTWAKGGSRIQAKEAADYAHHVYRRMTPTDQSIREQVLFWNWIRNNLPKMVKQVVKRPGQMVALEKGKRAIEAGSAENWKGVLDDELPRYYRRMMGVKTPMTGRGGSKFVLAFDDPRRDLNLLDADVDDLGDNLFGMLTPVWQMTYNALQHMMGEDLSIWGQRGRKVRRRPVELPRWLMAAPKAARRAMGARPAKDWIGADLVGDDVVPGREYIDARTLHMINELPMFLRLSKQPVEFDLTEQEKAQIVEKVGPRALMTASDKDRLGRNAYLWGVRMYAFDQAKEKEGTLMRLRQRARQAKQGVNLPVAMEPVREIPE